MPTSAKRIEHPLGPGFAILALAVIAAGAVLWARYGTLVYFDTIAAAFVGCVI